jgi:hypothetical protein
MVRSFTRSLFVVMAFAGAAAADPMPPEDGPVTSPATHVDSLPGDTAHPVTADPGPKADVARPAEPAIGHQTSANAKTEAKTEAKDAKKPSKTSKKTSKKSARHKKTSAHHDKSSTSSHKKAAKSETRKTEPASSTTTDASAAKH